MCMLQEPSPAKEPAGQVSRVMEARRNLLSILPRILASLSSLWKSVNACEEKQGLSGKEQAWTTLGAPKVILEFLQFTFRVTDDNRNKNAFQ